MNIQIFGKRKCFDTKKAERYFKERRIKYQYIDLDRFGISRGELQSVKNAVGLDALVDEKHPDAALIAYLARPEDKLERIFEDPTLLKRPSSAMGKRPPPGISRRCGKSGNKEKHPPSADAFFNLGSLAEFAPEPRE